MAFLYLTTMNGAIMNLAAQCSSRLSQALIGAIMACAWLYFAVLHVRAFDAGGNPSYLVFCVTETLTAMLFLVRSAPVSVSPDPRDWALALGATFLPFLFLPSSSAPVPQAALLVVAGALVQLTGMLSLNRSIGVVPALRVLKTGGLYRIVRHPLYASYLLTFSGYLLSNWSPRNLIVYLLSMALLAARIGREEAHLALDSDYRAYMGRVKFRVLPFVF
jgi:protein-S-isoprenylcysteine O-methyltransferase Ste14